MNKILSILLACTAAGAAYGAQETAQETGQAAKNVAIDSVVVTGARYASDIRHLPMSVAVVDRDEIVRRQEASVLPLLTEQVPGLFVTGRGVMGYGVSDGAAGGISLRGIGGGSAAQMLVLIDGHPQYMGLFGHPIADAYQSMLAERVEVVRGPASVLYGSNAMGGVINIVTRRQREEGVKTDLNVGYGSWNTLQTEAANRIRKGRFTSVVTGSYNRTDGHRADMGFEQYGGYAKVGYEISRRWNAYADVNLTHFNASNPGEITAPVFDNDSRITRGMASVSLENSYDRTSGALKFFYNWGRHRINDGYGAGEEPRDYRFNSKDRMLGVSWYQSAGLWRGSRLTAGIDWQRFGGRAWNRFTADGREEPIVDQAEDEIAGYADFRQSLGRLTVDAGVRIDHHTRTGTEWVPQAGISLRAARDGALKAMVSKGFRNPVLRELYMFGVKNPRSEARTAVELRTFVDPAAGRRKRVVRRQPLLYQGRGHHPARQGRRPQHPAQPGPDRKLGRRGRRRMAHRRGMERQCQLQLAPDGVSRAGVPRTQTLRRRRFREGPLVGVDGRAVHRRALHGGGSRSGSPGSGIRALEPARVAARKPFADDLRPGRKPAGRTL